MSQKSWVNRQYIFFVAAGHFRSEFLLLYANTYPSFGTTKHMDAWEHLLKMVVLEGLERKVFPKILF